MSTGRPFCFVIMPFRPELHYFYLYLKQHIEKNHNIDCERGDAQILTKPLLEKVADYIKKADVIVADCTGRNANVFYELGIAHAGGKQVILLSQDDVEKAPADIRHFEFIPYSLSDDAKFLADIDNALNNVFAARYEDWYNRARLVFKRFRQETKANVSEATKEAFVARMSAVERTRDLPLPGDDYGVTELLLPKIIADTSDVALMSQIRDWLSSIHSPPAPPLPATQKTQKGQKAQKGQKPQKGQ